MNKINKLRPPKQKSFKRKEMVNELIYELIGAFSDEREFIFIDYIKWFVYVTYKIIGKQQIHKDKFIKYVTNKNGDYQQKIAKKIYMKLQKYPEIYSKKANFIILESLLFQYINSLDELGKRSKEANKRNDIRHKDDRKLKNYIIELNNTKRGDMTAQYFYETYKDEILEFIKNNCQTIHEKILNNNDYDLQDVVIRYINERNKDIIITTTAP